MPSDGTVRSALISKPVLRPPGMTKEYILMTDSCGHSVGCVLMQPDDDENSPGHVIAFASRKLLPRERKYATVELELMAIVFGLTKFYQYIYNRPVKVYTDHRPLQWLNSITKHSSRLARWSLVLQNHNVTTTYIKGENQLADALSRLPM